MIDWNKYIKWGEFTSTNGIKLPFKWEFDKLKLSFIDTNIILSSILSLAYPYDIVSIYTVNPQELAPHCKAIYYPEGNLSVGLVTDKYVLYDDVVTTGKSMIDAIKKYGKTPEKCICLADRRNKDLVEISYESWHLEVISIMDMVLIDAKK